MFQLKQQWIEGSLVDGEKVSADLLDTTCNAKAMQWSEQVQSFKDHQSKCPLRDIGFPGHLLPPFGFLHEDARSPLGKQQECDDLHFPRRLIIITRDHTPLFTD